MKFIIENDIVATSYLRTHKKLTPKDAQWQDFLAAFSYVMEYKRGRANLVADVLSHKGELAHTSGSQSNLRECIKGGLQHDSLAQTINLVKRARLGDFG